MLGALIWQKEGRLRFSLDRADLWDLRPTPELHLPQFSYQWVYQHVLDRDYDTVQKLFDQPYDRNAAPTRIPGAAMQFSTANFGKVTRVRLYLQDALCVVDWDSGERLRTFIQAQGPVGWFRFDHLQKGDSGLVPELWAPPYQNQGQKNAQLGPVDGDDLSRLGYPPGIFQRKKGEIIYRQQGWGGLFYVVVVRWRRYENSLVGCWTIRSSQGAGLEKNPENLLPEDLARGFGADYQSHLNWWRSFWEKSTLHIPDTILENQWYREIYKFGSASRAGSPPISLQAVWTADNGKLPPWKGDFHHDLNTELSYWPGFSSNHLEESTPFTDWLWKIKPVAEQYTRDYFAKPGLDVPGVTTLMGKPMGGWIQYALSPTISCWLGQSFYWQWKYSMDGHFLRSRAYPWMKATAEFITALCPKGADGFRHLPISSSPEINDNSLQAWWLQFTNYDLSLIRWMYQKTAEMALAAGLPKEATRWKRILQEFPGLALGDDGTLLVAKGSPLEVSHRHMSNLMSIYPLALYDWGREADRKLILASLDQLRKLGTSQWCGYSFAWYGCLLDQARMGDEAARQLRIFAQAFCLPNSFHVNGDQTHSGYSSFTYRPFTLEGNFAFAQGVQQMLLQSNDDTIRIFPAIPAGWENLSFNRLRAEGAFLVSAKKENGRIRTVEILAEKGGVLRLENPFGAGRYILKGVLPQQVRTIGHILIIPLKPMQGIKFSGI